MIVTKLNLKYLVYVSVMFCSNFIIAQDIHHSQFYSSPLNANPALTGIFNGDMRFAGNYRSQWFVDDLVKYLTVTGSYDMKFFPKRWDRKGMWNGGILFNYDQAGDSKLSLGHLGITASYAYPLNTHNVISIGGLIGGSQRKFSQDKLVWGDQFNPATSQVDPNLPSGENFSNTSRSFLDLGAGINYRWQKSKRTKLDLGVGVYHLNKPEQKFFTQSASMVLPMRMNFNLTPSFKLTERLDLLLHAQHQIQGPYVETVLGGYGKVYLSTNTYKNYALLLGLAARLSDAHLIPKIALEMNRWYAGFSYDITTSPWKKANNQRGGPEFSLMYTITKARPLPQLKSCPIF